MNESGRAGERESGRAEKLFQISNLGFEDGIRNFVHTIFLIPSI
jgi:hypothetical protein